MFIGSARPEQGSRIRAGVTWGCGIGRAPSLQQMAQIAFGGVEETAPVTE